ncbi:MAG: glycosyltransferase [Dokdonella sp.]|uniref:glycosyltransferase n=1 Tax=Dokdonella sp. TaxID=2291710 RepID=UPI003267EE01
MRILHIGKYYAPERGGIERYTQALAEWSVARGDAVAVLCHQRAGIRERAVETIGGVGVRRAGCIAAPLYTPLSPSFPFELARALREFRPDLLHLHFPNPSCFFALTSPHARRLPWVVHWHADVPPDSNDWRLRSAYRIYRSFEQATLRRAAAVVATSQPYLHASIALTAWHAKTAIIPLGIADALPEVPKPSLWPAGTGLRLLAVGRLSRYKGFNVLIEALGRLHDVQLLIVGEGECAAELRALVHARGLDHRVAFAGALSDEDLASAYAAADAFALPSLDRGEAFGLVLLEAMRAGRAAVASDIAGSGVGFVIDDAITGILVPPGNAVALAEGIARLQDERLRARLGDAGRQRWREHFLLETSARRIDALYRSVAPNS